MIFYREPMVDPSLSLHLPACMLGPLTEPGAKVHKFWIGGNREPTSSLDRTMCALSLGGWSTGLNADSRKKSIKIGARELQYQFRFSSHEEMREWWAECV